MGLSSEAPPIHDGGDGEYYGYERRGVNKALIFAIGAFAVMPLLILESFSLNTKTVR